MKNKQASLFCIGLSLCLVSLTACSPKNDSNPPKTQPAETTQTPVAEPTTTSSVSVVTAEDEREMSSVQYRKCKRQMAHIEQVMRIKADLLKDFEIEDAQKYCVAALKEFPDDAQLNSNLKAIRALSDRRLTENERIAKWSAQANQGDATAQYNLGVAYSLDDGLEKDMDKAIEWFKKSAQNANADAAFNLGVIYMGSKDVAADYHQAKLYFEKAANQNDARAMAALGQFYELGKLGRPDNKKAFHYYLQSADLGDADAQLNTGVLYYEGRGTAKDINKAKIYFEKAANQGNENAKLALKGIKSGRTIHFNNLLK